MQATLLESSYSEYGVLEKVLCILCTRGGLFTAQHVSWLPLEQKTEEISMEKFKERQCEWLCLPDQSRRSCPTHTHTQVLFSTAVCIYRVLLPASCPDKQPNQHHRLLCISDFNCLFFLSFLFSLVFLFSIRIQISNNIPRISVLINLSRFRIGPSAEGSTTRLSLPSSLSYETLLFSPTHSLYMEGFHPVLLWTA